MNEKHKGDFLLFNACEATRKYQARMMKLFTKFDINYLYTLPFIELVDYEYYANGLIPLRIPCIYFLLHENKDVLYIGKAKDLRRRWSIVKSDFVGQYDTIHHMLERSVSLGNVRLAWYEIDHKLANMVEVMLIKSLKPKWNTAHNYG